jgi:hypothetical protein
MYDLHKLGWHSFQQLCLTVIREILGQTVEGFLDSNDGGRDGAFTGKWKVRKGEDLKGKFVFQCKFTSKADYVLKPSDLKDEIPKVKKLGLNGMCDCYILITNANISGITSQKIETSLKGVGIKKVLILNNSWLCQQIKENKRLRMLVPRVYGLGDLSEILDERAYAQAEALLSSLREELSKVVVTGAYQRAAEAIDQHGFVLLIGEPAAGKTTIASLLAMAALDQWGSNTLKVDDAGKVVSHWNPHEPRQFFWVDDAFGVTQYESFLTRGWNHIIPQIKTMLQQGTKIVMTSRDYIYNRARKDLKEGAFPLLQESQVVIDVHQLTLVEKRQILYNHLKLGRQLTQFLVGIKPHLENISNQPRFIPETARRLAEPAFTKELIMLPYYLELFVNKQEVFLQDILQGLDTDSRAALALVYMRNDNLESPVGLSDSEKTAIERIGSSLGGCTTALDAMRNSFVNYLTLNDTAVWKFKHPTIGDAFGDLLVRQPELMEIYILGTTVEKLLDQVTCGDVDIERAVIIPKKLFSVVINKLKDFSANTNYKTEFLSRWGARSHLDRFLTRRCSKDFLSLYLETNSEILERASNPGLYLDSVSEVNLALRLHETGLLPEGHRKKFVEKISSYTVNGDDLYLFESPALRDIFKEEEFITLRNETQIKLIPKLNELREKWESKFKRDRSAEDYIDPFLDSLKGLVNEFSEDEDLADIINKEIQLAEKWASDNKEEDVEDKSRTKLGDIQVTDNFVDSRSVFDDIDL